METKTKKYRVAVYYYPVSVEVDAKNETDAQEKAMSEVDNDDWIIPDIENAEIIEVLE